MRPTIVPRALALSALAALTAATLAAAAPPHRPADARALAQPPAPAARPYVRPADRWFGETRAVAVEGDRAYYSVGRAVAVADIGDPAGPRLIGRSAALVRSPGDLERTPITEIAVSGRWLWVITGRGKDGVALFDVQVPARPVLRASVPMPPERSIEAIVARGTDAVLLYADYEVIRLGVEASGLLALQIDPSGVPHIVGQWTPAEPSSRVYAVAWTAASLVVSGVYEFDGYVGRLQVIPSGNGRIRFEAAGFTAYNGLHMTRIVVDGCRLYGGYDADLSLGSGSVKVFDVCADPPQRLGESGLPFLGFVEPRWMIGSISAMTWGGRNLVFMPEATGGIWAIDATDPTSFTWSADSLIEPVTTTSACLGDSVVTESRLVTSGCGLSVLEMKVDAALPQLVGRVRHPPASPSHEILSESRPSLWAAGDAVLVARSNVLSTIDWGADVAPAVLGQVMVNPNGDAWSESIADIAVAGDVAWIADDHESPGVFGFDIRDRRRPVRVAQVPGWGDAVASDGALLVTAYPIRLFALTDRAAPRIVGSVDLGLHYAHVELFLADGRLYVASDGGFDSYDVSDPSNLTAVPVDRTTPALLDAAINDAWIVTLADDAAIRVYDRAAAKTGTIEPVARIPLPVGEASLLGGPPYFDVNLARVGDRTLVVASNERSLLAIDITDPAVPVVGVPYFFSVPSESIAVSGDRIYLDSGSNADVSSLDLGVLLVGSVLRLPFLANLSG